MSVIIDRLIACERAEAEDASYAYTPALWKESRLEIQRLRGRLARIATSPDDNPDHLRWLAADALRGVALGDEQ